MWLHQDVQEFILTLEKLHKTGSGSLNVSLSDCPTSEKLPPGLQCEPVCFQCVPVSGLWGHSEALMPTSGHSWGLSHAPVLGSGSLPGAQALSPGLCHSEHCGGLAPSSASVSVSFGLILSPVSALGSVWSSEAVTSGVCKVHWALTGSPLFVNLWFGQHFEKDLGRHYENPTWKW